MYVIDGLRDEIITETTYHKLDDDFTLTERLNHTVVGITVTTYLLTYCLCTHFYRSWLLLGGVTVRTLDL